MLVNVENKNLRFGGYKSEKMYIVFKFLMFVNWIKWKYVEGR